jgi:very-short-patch-repair endonuclease
MPNKIIPYRKDLKQRVRTLRKNQTPAEKELWQHIRKRKLIVEFHRQVPLVDYIVDFYCHEIGLAIELDGSIHDTQFLEDAKRQERIAKYGVRFLRFSNDEIITNMEMVLLKIKREVNEGLCQASPLTPLQRGELSRPKCKFFLSLPLKGGWWDVFQ